MKLFSPGQIGSLELKNRIVMPAMGLNFSPDGHVNQRIIAFYEERARGGASLIIMGGTSIDASYPLEGHLTCLGDDSFIPGWKALAQALHAHGAKLGVQLVHGGKYTPSSLLQGRQPLSASPVPSNLTGETPREISQEEIKFVQAQFARAAQRAKEAGCDLAEFNCCSGYLIREFLSPLTNKRTDQYGGDLEGRMRFLLEVVQKTREVVGKNFPIIIRLSAHEFLPGGYELEEARKVAKALEASGIDALSITGGGHETRIPLTSMDVPPGAFLFLSRGIKDVVSLPVIGSARLNDPMVAERALLDEKCDFVAMARALITDPMLAKKAQEGLFHEIRHCIACNQGCFDSVFGDKPVHCCINAQAGREEERRIKPAQKVKKVAVIGGGPGGMEAARVLALRGHEVCLYEKEEALGGQICLSSKVPGREEFRRVTEDLSHELERLKVEAHLGHEVKPSDLKRKEVDAVIVATGAMPIVPSIAGIELPHVAPAWNVLRETTPVGQKVAIIGGGAVGLSTAIFLAKKGALEPRIAQFLAYTGLLESQDALNLCIRPQGPSQREVVVLEKLDKLGSDIGRTTRWVILQQLKNLQVKCLTSVDIEEITLDGVMIQAKGQRQLIKADNVVIAVGAQGNDAIFSELKSLYEEIYIIGDAYQPKKALDAIHQAFDVACQI